MGRDTPDRADVHVLIAVLLLADAGPLVAAYDPRDHAHRACSELLRRERGPILVPEVALAETAYLLGERVGPRAELTIARSLRDREIEAVATEPADWARITTLVDKYLDLPLGLVDAAVVAIAERLRVLRLATLDKRHFSVVRPAHVGEFELVP